MGFFDSPNMGLRKRLPASLLPSFNRIEERAQIFLTGEPLQSQPYQLGIILALWIKAGEMMNDFQLRPKDSKKIQGIYQSCIRVCKDDSHGAFFFLRRLAADGLIFGVPEEFYIRLAFGMLPTEDMLMGLISQRRE